MATTTEGDSPIITFRRNLTAVCGLGVIVSLIVGCASNSPTNVSHHGAFSEECEPTTVRIEAADSLIAAELPEAISYTSTPWKFGAYDGQLLSTPNYRVYTTVQMESFVDQLPLFYELALAHYTSVLGDLPQPDTVLETYLFHDRRQWQAKTQQMLPDQANIFGSLGRGGFTTRGIAVLYYIDFRNSTTSRDTFAIAAHEGWHQYTQQTFRHTLPVWLEEGIATYMESFSLTHDGTPQFRPWANRERRTALARAVRDNDLIPLGELLRRSPQAFLESSRDNLLVYYAQVWALTRFMVEWDDGRYRSGLEEALQDAAHGRLAGRLMESEAIGSGRRRGAAMTSRMGPWIILEYLNSDLDEFEQQYLEFVDSLTSRRRW